LSLHKNIGGSRNFGFLECNQRPNFHYIPLRGEQNGSGWICHGGLQGEQIFETFVKCTLLINITKIGKSKLETTEFPLYSAEGGAGGLQIQVNDLQPPICNDAIYKRKIKFENIVSTEVNDLQPPIITMRYTKEFACGGLRGEQTLLPFKKIKKRKKRRGARGEKFGNDPPLQPPNPPVSTDNVFPCNFTQLYSKATMDFDRR